MSRVLEDDTVGVAGLRSLTAKWLCVPSIRQRARTTYGEIGPVANQDYEILFLQFL